MQSRRLTILLGEVNDRIYDLVDGAEPGLPVEFHCECGRDCDRRVLLLPAAFAALRRDGRPVRAPECRGHRTARRVAARRAGSTDARVSVAH